MSVLAARAATATSGGAVLPVGAARIDVTPTEPIRLTGYASRKQPNVGVEQRLWAKALAMGADRVDGAAGARAGGGPAVLITLDNCGIAAETWREVRARLARSAKLAPDRVVIASSHTHSGPATTLWAPNIFVQDLTADELGAIDRYTTNLVDKLETVALAALQARRPGRLSWSQGSVEFAANRRTKGGPVDHSLPVLKAEAVDGQLLAIVANYACHCTTLGGEFNHVCGDWAGYAQQAVEEAAPGAVALVTIGCGADANPSPRGGADGGLALARDHGREVGAEVKRLLTQNFRPLTSPLSSEAREIDLPFGPLFTRDQWLARSTNAGIVGYHAKKWLARLDRGEPVPTSLYYPITTWHFGNELALAFLPGEVVVDYAFRLKTELDASRLWVTAYANYVPCYIPSRRILAEGGYEAEESLWYYDRPARLSTNAEDLIIRTVKDLVPGVFRSSLKKAERPDPLSPREALNSFQLATELAIELVAAEPMVQSPVAIDWDARGRLWVCEMFDYPAGLNPPSQAGRKYGEPLREPPGGFTPGGRVKVLTDVDGDGLPDRSTVFLAHIPFPTGVMPWGKGALICAAPNILYAEDTNDDGVADVVRTNVTGFATHNYQARVNGFTWGLDGWLHGSSGLFGGKVKVLRPDGTILREVDLSGRDFRYRPDTGELEPVSGISQMGRVRDEFDQWFGNDNSTWLWHYPLPDHYLRRNPAVVYPEPRVSVARGADINRLHPASRTLTRFNDPQSANIVTSACGPDLYRDQWLGEEYYGNAFICEPVHNLVRRLELDANGSTFAGRRATREERGEFLSSRDNWFRPVQVRTGPDGALYVVDMYRFVIEHPRWIPPERLQELDVRAGADRGRIYRIVRQGSTRRPVRNLAALGDEALVVALNTPNGPTRDLAHREMLRRALPRADEHGHDLPDDGARRSPGKVRFGGMSAVAGLSGDPRSPAVQAQALAVLGAASGLSPGGLRAADARVRRLALRLAEPELASGRARPETIEGVLTCASDPDPAVRLQAALSLGEWSSTEATRALVQLMTGADPWLRAAILSSARPRAEALLQAVLRRPEADNVSKRSWVGDLMATALAAGGGTNLAELADSLLPAGGADAGGALEVWRLAAIESFVAGVRKQGVPLELLRTESERGAGSAGSADAGAAAKRLADILRRARDLAMSPDTDRALRDAACKLLGTEDSEAGMETLLKVLHAAGSSEGQGAALAALGRSQRLDVGRSLLAGWDGWAPSLRGRIVDALLNRPAWAGLLLDALERDQVRPTEIGPSARQRLLASSTEAMRARAGKLFGTGLASARAVVLEKFAGVKTMSGSAERGVAVFDRTCAQCHLVRGRGYDVGPNLAEFAGKDIADYLLAVLDPNAAINPNFLAYSVETKDGRSLTGLVRDETASSLTVVQGGGGRETVLRSAVGQVRASAVSLMPEGLEQGLAAQDLADLIAWLRGAKPARFGSATAEQATKARRDFAEAGAATAIRVERAVERLPYPSWLGRWPLAYCRQNAGQERLVWTARAGGRPGDHGRTTFRFPAAMGLQSEAAGGFTLRINGRGVPVPFDVTLSDQSWASADGRVRMIYSVREANAEDSCGELAVEVAEEPGQSPAEPVQFEVTGAAKGSQRWFGIYLADE